MIQLPSAEETPALTAYTISSVDALEAEFRVWIVRFFSYFIAKRIKFIRQHFIHIARVFFRSIRKKACCRPNHSLTSALLTYIFTTIYFKVFFLLVFLLLTNAMNELVMAWPWVVVYTYPLTLFLAHEYSAYYFKTIVTCRWLPSTKQSAVPSQSLPVQPL